MRGTSSIPSPALHLVASAGNHNAPPLQSTSRERSTFLLHQGFAQRHSTLLLLAFAILAGHAFVVWHRPANADTWAYLSFAAATGLALPILWRLAVRTRGFKTRRWKLFFAYVCGLTVIYANAALAGFTHLNLTFIRDYLSGIAFTLVLVALTAPSRTNIRAERLIDTAVALDFCVLRIIVLIARDRIFLSGDYKLLYFTLSIGVCLCIALTAAAASSEAEYPFFRIACLYFAFQLIGCFTSNQIAYTLLHQQDASPWALPATLCTLLFALYATDAFDYPPKPRKAQAPSLVLQSVLPFTMSILIVAISLLLLPLHPAVAIVGITAGVVAQLTRTVLLHLRLRREAELLALSNHRLDELAHFDSLTGLRNRRSFQIAAAKALHLFPIHEREPEHHVSALLIFDVDGFKGANDAFGHLHGDSCLVEIALLLKAIVPSPDDNTFRLGGDEFAAILIAPDIANTLTLASHICERIADLQLHGKDRHLTISAGVALFSTSLDANTLLNRADLAMYRAKMQGGDCVELYNDDEQPEPVITPGRRLRSARVQ